ncbi:MULTISPECIES: HlyD family efflux transporter periplasmic adaptor subunit [unclassified Leptolyngbya]|uniref:HlyD family secretion protein n=1 Tax=unclassified Leptolyngbya TaxID=2650499 RepID=UPI00168438F1|nr:MULTISPECIES: HlyD family efflux transporter periplasmic adaptor subunit [unclassified Leptolyngbya]MBD1911310.1 HlyD family efflux transporter periplasmic adaptor subunit [Leptolyngbya sp. FACHB-8]MBD2156672.1 HlyD family efflux transporter periplasmic adaptor subunit [Leptolyngbya sp. FACHB-16]
MVETPTKPSSLIPPIAASHSIAYPFPEEERSPALWQRLAIAAACLGLGFAAVSTGSASILYRLTHTTVREGLVTGRLVRLQTPMEGEIKDFFASSGVDVQSGQVLARVVPGQQQQQTLLQLQGDVAEKTTQLAAARQLLDLLTNQLQSLEQQEKALQEVNTAIASDDVTQHQAMVSAALARATAAQADFERYQQLLAAGVVSQQQVDHLRAEWEAAQAAVEQTQAGASSAVTKRDATQQGIGIRTGENQQEQRMALMQSIQTQAAIVRTLSAQLETSQKQLKQTQAAYGSREALEVKAPFSGVIYSTERETGEQVSRPDVLLTLLDCNTLWVEVLVSAQQAHQIDPQRPVRVQLANTAETVMGDVELIEAISRADLVKDQTQALTPAIPEHLVGQPLTRIRVSLPPNAEQSQAQQLCGVGQAAQLTFGLKGLIRR